MTGNGRFTFLASGFSCLDAIGCRALGSRETRNVLGKLAIQRQRLFQQTQILGSRDFDRPKRLKMGGDILRVEQSEASLNEALYQCDKRDF